MELPLLTDIVIILGLSVLIILLFQRLKLPPILGFLITGVIAGPHGLNLIQAVHEVEIIAEIGIIFLLFVIGIEFSLKGLSSIRNTVIFGGLMQVGGTIGLTALGSYVLGLSIQSAIFMGFLIALSSTAIVLKILQERGELRSPHGRISIAILIFQDIVVVLMMLLTPLLAGEFEDLTTTLLVLAAKMIGVVLFVILMAKYIVPLLFNQVVKTKSTELFLLTVILLCFATAWLTSEAGLSLALGAFFAGLVISESPYSHQATANILPFREIFISFFFVSVGMLLNLSFFIDHILNIHLLALGVVLLKLIVIALSVLILGYPARTVLMTALAIFQVGEFAFLLSTVGIEYNLLSRETYQYFLAISIMTMGATPFVIKAAPSITNTILLTPLPSRVRKRLESRAKVRAETAKHAEGSYRDHLVIIGYGINGENLARAARTANIPYVVVELDPDAIERARKNGDPVVYGDATNEIILKHVHVQEARVVVIAISSPDATRRIIRIVRSFSETVYLVVRTRLVKECTELERLGADFVIPEEFETSIEIFTRVLKKYLIPNDQILKFVHQIRHHNYQMLRSLPALEEKIDSIEQHIPEVEIATVQVYQGHNRIVGKKLVDSGLRKNYGVTVLAIRRGDHYITEVLPDTVILQDDILYIFGHPDDIIKLNEFFRM